MIGLIKDMFVLVKLELPTSFCKKRIILNFVHLYILSLPSMLFSSKKSGGENIDDVHIESKIWQSFNHIISMYVKYISPKYYMITYVIKGVATSWHSNDAVKFIKENFTEKHINNIPKHSIETVNKVSKSIASKFKGIDYETVNRWLLTYQYGLNKFYKNPNELSDKLANTHIIELGAGTGANIAVHAALSNKGVSIFDIPPMLKLQKSILGEISENVDMSDISYFSDTDKLMEQASKQPYIIVSYWAFTEFPEDLRRTLDPLLRGAEFSFFACNSEFEGINNLDYFNVLGERLEGKTVTSETIDWNPFKKHSYVMIK